MIRVLLLLSVISLHQGCSSKIKRHKKLETDFQYQGIGTSKYFLAPLPEWANSVESLSCQRTSIFRYINLPSLRQSYNLQYEQALQFQILFQKGLQENEKEKGRSTLSMKEEELIFLRVMDQVHANFKGFRLPEYKRVNLIIIDSLWGDPKAILTLKKLMKSSSMTQGHPVALSFCHSSAEISKKLKKWKISANNIRIFPMEFLSPFNVKGEITPMVGIDLNHIFKKEQKLHVYIPQDINKPSELRGQFTIHKY